MSEQINDENPHTLRGDGYTITYWRNNIASGPIDADRANVSNSYHTYHALATFELPRQERELEQLRWLLANVFEAGRHAKTAEVRRVLGL